MSPDDFSGAPAGVATGTVLLYLVGTLADANGISYPLCTDSCVTGCMVAPGKNVGVITFRQGRAAH
jgi:hypothetical protein